MLKIVSAAAAALSGIALAVAGFGLAGYAQAAPIPGVAPDVQVHSRLAMLGADRPDAPVLANQVCGILHSDPTPAGKRAARDHLMGAGVTPGVQDGWTLGTMVDVMCPEMVSVLR
ncbi:hypothetical protein [Nocardia sp. NPDC024068]|uniref:hypothetical protein n=1 Tax=Nocardia sp. NPDC024068 TaxID=3157197 RepID=UPI0033DB067C